MAPLRLLSLWALCALPAFADEGLCAEDECEAPVRGDIALQHRSKALQPSTVVDEGDEEMDDEADEEGEEEFLITGSPEVEVLDASLLQLNVSKETMLKELEEMAAKDVRRAELLREARQDERWGKIITEMFYTWAMENGCWDAWKSLKTEPRSLIRHWRRDDMTPYRYERDGVAYGLSEDRDDVGPIGGGHGYTKIVSRDKASRIISRNDPQAFVDAVNAAHNGEVIYVDETVELDLGSLPAVQAHGPWETQIAVKKHITIASNRGEGVSPGALLDFSNMKWSGKRYAIFSWKTLRLTGLRIKGPLTAEREWTGPGKGDPRTIGLGLDQAAEVDNCEIFAFNHACIKANYKASKGYTYVHHSHIHSTHFNGLGYGVTTYVAPLRVEFCQFERNRHAIASTGKPTASWEAHHIAVLEPNLHSAIDMHEPNGHYFQLWNSYIQSYFYFKERGTVVKVADSWARLNYIPSAKDGSDWRRYRHEDCNVYRNGYIWSKCPTSVAEALQLPGPVKRGQKALLA